MKYTCICYIYMYIYIYVFISVSVCMSTYVYLFISSHLSYVIHINPLKKMAQFRPRRHGLRIRGGQDVDGHQRCLCTTGSTAGEATDQVRCAAAIAFFAPWQRKGSWMMGWPGDPGGGWFIFLTFHPLSPFPGYKVIVWCFPLDHLGSKWPNLVPSKRITVPTL